MARSKIYTVDGRKVSYEFNSDGQIIGVLDHSNPFKPKHVDPRTDLFTDLVSDRKALTASNFNNYGGNKKSYSDTVSLPSQEELNAHYGIENKSDDNTENIIEETVYPNIDDGIANPNLATQSPAFAAYKSTRKMQSGTDFFTYPLDIDPMQDHLKISKYIYARNEDSGVKSSVQGSRPPRVDTITVPNTFGEKLYNIGLKEERQIKPVKLERVFTEGDSMLGNQLQGSVMLPMPKVVDTNGCEWGESEVNIFGLAALGTIEQGGKLIRRGLFGNPSAEKLGQTEALSGVEKEDIKAAQEITRKAQSGKTGIFKNIKPGGSALLNAFAAEATARVTGQSISQDQILARTSGRVLNPNAELLFQGPVLRDFNFDFLMIARSEKEGKEIRKIIRWFKSGMAPKYNNSTFLKTPDVFKLEYKNGVGDGDILKTVNRFSPGGLALRTVAVDYAPSGYWSAYQDSQPVALKMSLNFAELRPIYSQDQNQDELIDTVGY